MKHYYDGVATVHRRHRIARAGGARLGAYVGLILVWVSSAVLLAQPAASDPVHAGITVLPGAVQQPPPTTYPPSLPVTGVPVMALLTLSMAMLGLGVAVILLAGSRTHPRAARRLG